MKLNYRIDLLFNVVASLGMGMSLMGCGMGNVLPSTGSTYSSEATIEGRSIGGQQAIQGGTVNLYRAGATGYGKGFTKLATYTTDANGWYYFNKSAVNGTGNSGTDANWSCPTDGSDPLIYLITTGGNTGGVTANGKAVLASMIGPCSQVSSSTHIDTNEITTVAFTASFAQWMYPGSGSTPGDEGIGSNGAYCLSATLCNAGATAGTTQSALGLYNAYLNYTNLSDNYGNAIVSTAYTGTDSSVAGITVTATPESVKLTTIADILASCINTDGTVSTGNTCAKLFGAAAPPVLSTTTTYGSTNPFTFTVAADTLQASLYMTLNPAGLTSSYDTTDCGTSTATSSINPTFNVACLFGLATANPPFAGALTSAPSDWSIGITYRATGTCPNGGSFFAAPIRSAVDASGNLFFVNAVATNANIAELDPAGHPMLCLGTSGTGSGHGITIDPTGNVWAAFNTDPNNGLEEIAKGTSSLLAWPIGGANTQTAQYLTSDGSGNIWATTTLTGGSLYRFTAPGTSTTPVAASLQLSQINQATTTSYFDRMSFDSSGNLFVAGRTVAKIFELAPSAGNTGTIAITKYNIGSTGNITLTFAATTAPTVGSLVSLSGFTNPTYSGYVNGANIYITASTTTTASAHLPTYPATNSGPVTDSGSMTGSGYLESSVAATGTTQQLLVNGSGNVLIVAGCCGTNGGGQLQYNNISNSVLTASSSTYFQGGLNGGRSLALDGAGNVWMGNTYASVGTSTATGNWAVSELAYSGAPGSTTFTSLSPDGLNLGANCSSTVGIGCPDGGGFIKQDLLEARDLSTDSSGSVWVLATSDQTGASAQETLDGQAIVKIVGVSVPVITPISVATHNGTIGTKP